METLDPFITEKELYQLQQSYLYRDLPFAYIFYRELIRKKNIAECVESYWFWNFYSKFNDEKIETMFPDNSFFVLNFKEKKCYVIHPTRGLFKEFNYSAV
ncbi:hypothetical protein ACKLNO_01225 [Neisseriaceae bacterium B1]